MRVGVRLDTHTIRPLPGEVFWVERSDGDGRFLRSVAESPEITISYQELSPEGEAVECAHTWQGFLSEFLGARFQSLGLMHDQEWEQFAAFLACLDRERIGSEELAKFSLLAMRSMVGREAP